MQNSLSNRLKKYKSLAILFLILLIVSNVLLAVNDQINVLIPLLISGILFLGLVLFSLLFRLSRATWINYILSISSIFFALSAVELTVRVQGKYWTFSEEMHDEWRSDFKAPVKKNYLHIWTPETEVEDTSPSEYSYFHKSNSLGLIGPEPVMEKDVDTYRVIGIGDSFTQGIGAPGDSCWLIQMQSLLNVDTNKQTVSIINAGVAGSDPFYEYQLLKQLTAYKADLVIMVVNRSDINDFSIRGGWERFKPDSTIQYREPPWYESFYRMSHIVRLVVRKYFKKNSQFQSLEEWKVYEKKFLYALEDVVVKTQALCKKHQMDFLLVFHPTVYEFRVQSSSFTKSAQNFPKMGVKAIDLYDTFKTNNWINETNYDSFFWTIDKHYNSKGYHYMGKGIADKIRELDIIPNKTSKKITSKNQ